jgi:putative resolvase
MSDEEKEEQDYTVWIKPKEAAELLRVTPNTLIRWDKEGKINTSRTPSGQRRYDLQDVKNNAGVYTPYKPKIQKYKVCYCRVSSRKQSDDLERQKDFFRHKYPKHRMVTDIGSGLNWKRKGLQTILEQSMSGNISEVVVAHRDRLCRFAFELLEFIFKYNGIKLVVLNKANDKSNSSELTDDIMSIIHVYSCREMGKRKYSKQKTKDLSQQETEEEIETVDGNEEICI